MYVSDGESYAAKWVKEYSEEGTTIYANGFALEVILSQGRITRHRMPGSRASQFTADKEMDGYIYLRYLDIADGGLVAKYPSVFAERSKVYANGNSEVYK